MSPVCSQPSASIASAVMLRLVAVAGHHHVAAHEQLAVVRQLDLDARARRPDGADLHRAGRVDRAEAAGLRHPPQLRQRDADGVEEDEHVARRRRRAGVDGDRLVQAEHRAQPARTGSRRPPRRAARRPRAPARRPCSSSTLRRAAVSQPTVCSPWVENRALEPRLELLEDPRHREEPRRPDGRQVGDDLAHHGARGDRHAEHDRQVVVRHPLGDVRGRQPRDHARAVGEADDRVGRPRARHHVAVRELDALGRAGRPGRVDQREQVVGLDRLPVRRRRRSPGRRPRRRPSPSSPRPAPPSSTISVSSAGSSARAAPNVSRNAASTIATLASASPTT